jgi:hypothetical protein
VNEFLGIVYFLVAVIVVYEIAGSKPTVYFLILVIIGIIFTNSDKITKLKISS